MKQRQQQPMKGKMMSKLGKPQRQCSSCRPRRRAEAEWDWLVSPSDQTI
jgi:hypothetical protein